MRKENLKERENYLKRVVMSVSDLCAHFKETIINDSEYYTQQEVFSSAKNIILAYPELQKDLDSMVLDLVADKELHHLIELLSPSCNKFKKLLELPIDLEDLYPNVGYALIEVDFSEYSAKELYTAVKIILEVFPEEQQGLNRAASYILDKKNMYQVLSLVTSEITAEDCSNCLLSIVDYCYEDCCSFDNINTLATNLKKLGILEKVKSDIQENAALAILLCCFAFNGISKKGTKASEKLNSLFDLTKDHYLASLSTYASTIKDYDLTESELINIINHIFK